MGALFRKFYLLVWKNFILQIRRPIGTVVEIVLPIGFLALLILAREEIERKQKCTETFDKTDILNESRGFFNPRTGLFNDSTSLFGYKIRLWQKEKRKVSKDGLRLGYYPINDKTTKLLENELIRLQLPLKLAKLSVNGSTFGNVDHVIGDAKEYEDNYIGVIVFDDDDDNQLWNKKVKYTIRLHHTTGKLYNSRGRGTFRTNRVYNEYTPPGAVRTALYKSPFLTLQYLVDSALIRKNTGGNTVNAARFIQQFPYPEYTEDTFLILIRGLIPLMIILSFIYTAQMVVKEIVAEKEARIIECMKMMGLPKWIHWSAWFTKIFAMFFVILVIQTLILKYGKIFEFSHGGVIFVTLLLWVLASIFSLFFISVLFSRATRGMIAASILWFGTFAPFLAVQSPDSYDLLKANAKSAMCLLPNTCLGVMIQIIIRYEGEQLGVDWQNINKPVTVDENFALNWAFGMLVLDCFLFLFLTWYIENVCPGEYGIPKPWYFPFQGSYWCGTFKVKDRDHGDMDHQMSDGNFEAEPTDLEVGISINNLRKVFKSATGKKLAVDELSLNIYKGQITALLGHNGAGKTTTLSMLTGLFPPSSGGAVVNGKSITTDMDSIRDSLGLCPQHNVLFDRLTVREHLQFFSALKGVPKAEAEIEITKLLTDMQLLNKTNQQSSTLSGGMKRKLNCAIALVGGSETVILDEPTSGMDPYARRATWDVLQRYRGNKTIILTTHFMDEADYLGDRIAIMADGKVRCCGSSLFLKKRFGVGYHLTLVKGPEFRENSTLSLISNIVPSAKMTGNVAAEISYILHEDSSRDFKQLFETLENNRGDLGVTNFGVSVTTLEEVFIKVGEGFSFETNNSNEEELVSEDVKLAPAVSMNNNLQSVKKYHGCNLRLLQFIAMFRKRFLNSVRQKKGIALQLLLPLGAILLGMLLSLSQNTQQDDPPRLLTLKMLKSEDNELFGFYGVSPKDENLLKYARAFYESEESGNVQLQDVSDKIENIEMKNKGNAVNVLYSKNPVLNRNLGTNLSVCCDYQYLMLNRQCLTNKVKCKKGKCDLNPMQPGTSYLQEYILEDSGKKVKKYFVEKVAGITRDDKTPGPIAWYSNQAWHTLPSAYSAVNNIILRNAMNDDAFKIETVNHPLPRNTREKSELSRQNWGNLTLIIFVLIGITLLAGSFIIFLVTEKVSKAKHVQFVSGVNSVTYWTATYCWDFINYLVPAFGILILFAIFDLDDYRGELGPVFLVTLLYGLSVLPGVYLLSFLFTSTQAAYGFITMLVQLLSLAMYIAVTICDLFPDLRDEADIMHHVFMLFPTYAYPKALGFIAINVAERANCKANDVAMLQCLGKANLTGRAAYQDDTLSMDSPGIGLPCLYMFIVAVVEFLLVLLVEENFFLGLLFTRGSNKIFAVNDNEDADVTYEKQRVHAMSETEKASTALVVEDLTKIYRRNGMMAVDHISLGIPKGECFGLLGVNGAGKTTTFGMLTGELSMTQGNAYIHGYSLQTELKKIQQLIGYCPQFDALIETMTGREMLHMFAQLRGIDSSSVRELVQDVIDSLNLKEWADKMCGTYSGGNKRKLSTAMALVGDPAVIFLDEPSSGMDPVTRRHLWNTLSAILSHGKSIILTSHSMEECEALCTRLVIMVNGKFKCIGSLQHLKSRFGQGYTLMLKVQTNFNIAPNPVGVQYTNIAYQNQGDVSEKNPIGFVMQFMQVNFPGAVLIEEHHGFLQFQIIQEDLMLSQLFGLLEDNRTALGILDYSVSQTSLEQVFINFAKAQHVEDDRRKQSTFCACQCF